MKNLAVQNNSALNTQKKQSNPEEALISALKRKDRARKRMIFGINRVKFQPSEVFGVN